MRRREGGGPERENRAEKRNCSHCGNAGGIFVKKGPTGRNDGGVHLPKFWPPNSTPQVERETDFRAKKKNSAGEWLASRGKSILPDRREREAHRKRWNRGFRENERKGRSKTIPSRGEKGNRIESEARKQAYIGKGSKTSTESSTRGIEEGSHNNNGGGGGSSLKGKHPELGDFFGNTAIAEEGRGTPFFSIRTGLVRGSCL